MSTVAATKLNFPGPIGTKRRRMRSGGNVSTITNNAPVQASLAPSLEDDDEDDMSDSKAGGKCKGVTTIPIFLKSKCSRAVKMFAGYSFADRCARGY